jgi:hypothetical protein
MSEESGPASARILYSRIWDSATLMTWLSVVTRAMSVLIVLPLLLTRFSLEEIGFWYLLASLIGLQQLADVGFAPTFVRVISYAMGGASRLKDQRGAVPSASGEPRWDMVERIWCTMTTVYRRLTFPSVVLFALLGTLALRRPISGLEDRAAAWTSWVVVVGTFAVIMRSSVYAAYIQGTNRVALLRRWETIASVGAMVSSVIVLIAGGRLLALVISNQIWLLLNAARNWWLCRTIDGARASRFKRCGPDAEVMNAVWGSAIRSGLGVVFSRGVILSSGVVYAQFADAAGLAAYLLAFRVMQMLMDFSNAPFYSKVPLLSNLRSQGREAEQIALASSGMRLAYWSYVAGVIGTGIAAPLALRLVGSNADWVTPSLWAVMALAFFVERFGAMHIQLYSTTNHIIWHTANGVSGTIYLITSAALLPLAGVFAFPIGILVGYLSFYSWYAPLHVYRAFTFDFWSFQRETVLLPGALLVLFAMASFLS